MTAQSGVGGGPQRSTPRRLDGFAWKRRLIEVLGAAARTTGRLHLDVATALTATEVYSRALLPVVRRSEH
jgi:hypothetical protein